MKRYIFTTIICIFILLLCINMGSVHITLPDSICITLHKLFGRTLPDSDCIHILEYQSTTRASCLPRGRSSRSKWCRHAVLASESTRLVLYDGRILWCISGSGYNNNLWHNELLAKKYASSKCQLYLCTYNRTLCYHFLQ